METAAYASEALLRLNAANFLPVRDDAERKDCGAEDEGKDEDLIPPRVGTPDFKPETQSVQPFGSNAMFAFPFGFTFMSVQDKCTCNCSKA